MSFYADYWPQSEWSTDDGIELIRERTAQKWADAAGVDYSPHLCSRQQARVIALHKAYSQWRKAGGRP
jgi:hypothetical protein